MDRTGRYSTIERKPVPRENDSWLALDVGGANIKAAHSSGAALCRAFALWKYPEGIAAEIGALASGLPPFGRVALTMTAELCDCYATKRQGVSAVLDAVVTALPGRPLAVWGVDGQFHTLEEVRIDPLVAAASNWLALATSAARLGDGSSCLLIDVGATTTDLIPISEGTVVARGRTDTERLRYGELVYAGVQRTPLCALASRVPYRGSDVGLAAELFATTLDVFLVSGEIPENPDDVRTADGRPATVELACNRLARMVAADHESFTLQDATSLSQSFRGALLDRLLEAAETSCRWLRRRPESVILSGSGEFLGREVARRVLPETGSITSLAERWGAEASVAACARALLELVGQSEGA
jgi:probable H4MPT-linked C1 transfer pathway protein